MSDYLERIARLQTLLRSQEAFGAILAGTDQMRYLTGWREGGHERFVGLFIPQEGAPAFVVPSMNASQARKTPAGIKDVFGWEDSEGWTRTVKELIAGWSMEAQAGGVRPGTNMLVDDELLSVHLLKLQSLFGELKFEPIGETMRVLREVKTDMELRSMQIAADLIDEVYSSSLKFLSEGMTETEFADRILSEIGKRGSTPSFSPLICFGANAALPHHHTGATKLKKGDIVIIDIGCTSDGYASDITRTVSFGEPSDPDARKVYEIVYEAHHAAIFAARPGVTGEEIDSAARTVISDAGYGEYFIHRLGHGIGLSCHEPPSMVKGNLDPVKQGMCFSVEPGIYLEGRFGVRLENIVTVTETGVRSLNAEVSPTLKIV